MSDDEIDVATPRWVETVDGRKYALTPARPDYRWVPGQGRVKQEPKNDFPRVLPAPPDVAVWVAGDIAMDVKCYAERREAEKRQMFPTFQRAWTA